MDLRCSLEISVQKHPQQQALKDGCLVYLEEDGILFYLCLLDLSGV